MASKTRTMSRFRRFTALAEKAAQREHVAVRLRSGAVQGALSVTAAVIAYIPPSALGLREGFWASITALSVTQAELTATHSTARDQFIGGAIGGIVGASIAHWFGHGLVSYAFAVFFALVLAWLTNVPSAARLAGITVTIIMLVPHQTSDTIMLASRMGEVTFGILAALIVATPFSLLRKRLEERQVDGNAEVDLT